MKHCTIAYAATWRRAVLVVAMGPVAFAADIAAAQSPAHSVSVPAGQIRSFWTQSVRTAYLDHEGQYWALGPVFGQIRDYAATHGLSGAYFVRYLQSSPGPSAEFQKIRVGILVDEDHEVQPPLMAGALPHEWVASVEVETGPLSLQNAVRDLYEWLRPRGFDSAGTITEIYPQRPHGQLSAGSVEVRMGIRSVTAARRTQSAFGDEVHNTAPSPTSADTSAGPAVIGAEEVLPSDAAVDTMGDTTKAEPSKNEHTVPEHQLRGATPEIDAQLTEHSQTQTISHAPDNTETPEAQGESTQTQWAAPPIPASAPEVPRTGDDQALSPTAEPAVSPIEYAPIGALFDAADAEGVARQLIPNAESVPRAIQVWLGQFVFRLRALQRALERTPGDADGRTLPILAAISKRFAGAAHTWPTDVLSIAVVHTPAAHSHRTEQLQAAMHSLDRLLATVASGAANADQIDDSLRRTLVEAQAVVWNRAP